MGDASDVVTIDEWRRDLRASEMLQWINIDFCPNQMR